MISFYVKSKPKILFIFFLLIFLGTNIFPIFLSFINQHNPIFFAISFVIFLLSILLWCFSIIKRIGKPKKHYLKEFLLILFPLAYGFFMGANLEDDHLKSKLWFWGLLIFFHFFSMFCVFYLIYLAAKTIKSAELGRTAKTQEFIAEFFSICFFLLGVWYIQPKINNLAK